jgi:uncharacterized protein (TIGR02996 family)
MPRRRIPPSPLPCEPYWQALPGSGGLLHAIAEEPSDEGLRLILADWLEDHGESDRAAFIRTQLQGQRLPWWEGERWESLNQWAAELLRDNQDSWLAGLPQIEGVCWDAVYNFSGGLLERLTLDWDMFRQQAEPLFAAVDLRGLIVRQPRGNCKKIGNEEAEALAASPHLARLSCLDLSSNQIGDEGACALAASPHLAGLSSLKVSCNNISYEGAAALAASPYLASLSCLDLSGNHIGAAGAAALAASPHLAGLYILGLQYNEIGDKGAAALAVSPHLAGLSSLVLRDNHIGDEAAALLRARWPFVRL